MKPPAQRAGQWLGFEMIKERRPIAPHFVTAQFDQPGAKHNAKDQPAEQRQQRIHPASGR